MWMFGNFEANLEAHLTSLLTPSRGYVREEECCRLYSSGERLRDREIKHNVSEYGIAGSVLFIERQSVFLLECTDSLSATDISAWSR